MKPLALIVVVVCSLVVLAGQRLLHDRELERINTAWNAEIDKRQSLIQALNNCSGLLAEKIAPLESLK